MTHDITCTALRVVRCVRVLVRNQERSMSLPLLPVCPPCGKPVTTGVALNEVAWKDDRGEEVDCTICAYPMSADSEANPWTGPGLFLTQACVNGHVYHKGCLLTHMSRSNFNTATCPECRNPILSEVAASLRRNGAPAPVPPPLNSGGGGLFGGGGGAGFGGGGGSLFGGGNAPAPAPGGGLFGGGGGGANQDDFWSGGQEEADAAAERLRERERRRLNNDDAASLWERIHGGGANLPPPPPMERAPTVSGDGAAWWRGEISREEAERRSQARLDAERRRMERETIRAGQLPYQSLGPLEPMTGVNGHFFLVGALNDYPTPGEVMQGLRRNVDWLHPSVRVDKLHIKMSEQNLNPFHGGSGSGGMKVTLFQYEFNGLTDEEGDDFLAYYRNMAGDNGELSGSFYQELFNLPTEPLVGVNGSPMWGEDMTDLPPTLVITPDMYDDWARRGRASRQLMREAEEGMAQNRAQEARMLAEMASARAQPAPAPAGPRTRARAAREEREQLDEF